MKNNTSSTLMQSKYFNPAFNSAIFDGPLRIYFAQFHEALALKIYFLIQQKWPQEFARAKELSKKMNSNVLILIYPTNDSFVLSMENHSALTEKWVKEDWNQDVVVALRGALEDDQMEPFLDFAGLCLRQWSPADIETPLYESSI